MNEQKYFNRGKWIFMILVAAVLLLMFPFLTGRLFSDHVIEDWEKELKYAEQEEEWQREDSADTSSSEGMKKMVWKWKDFENKMHKITFEVNAEKLSELPTYREQQGNDLATVYRNLHGKSLPIMKPMIEAFKSEIKEQKYAPREAYMKAMELVVTAVQYIPYTLVLDDSETCPCRMGFGTFTGECKVREDGRGCCSGVMPLGVYAPAEFMDHKLGDCDTRSLFAYLILNELGYDVAVMVSLQEGHSVLGVHMKNRTFPNYGQDKRHKKYYLWELTAKGCRLGYDVEGDDWLSYHN